jgi:hypothetical protein
MEAGIWQAYVQMGWCWWISWGKDSLKQLAFQAKAKTWENSAEARSRFGTETVETPKITRSWVSHDVGRLAYLPQLVLLSRWAAPRLVRGKETFEWATISEGKIYPGLLFRNNRSSKLSVITLTDHTKHWHFPFLSPNLICACRFFPFWASFKLILVSSVVAVNCYVMQYFPFSFLLTVEKWTPYYT